MIPFSTIRGRVRLRRVIKRLCLRRDPWFPAAITVTVMFVMLMVIFYMQSGLPSVSKDYRDMKIHVPAFMEGSGIYERLHNPPGEGGERGVPSAEALTPPTGVSVTTKSSGESVTSETAHNETSVTKGEVSKYIKVPLSEELLVSVEGNTGEVFEGVDAKHFHGKVGLTPDGQPAWQPTPIRLKMTDEQRGEYHKGYCFNTRVSESVALDRPVPDFNHQKCNEMQRVYGRLPQASVIIVFHNENFSVLIRSVHSILNRTPAHLLKEIILVDDYSNGETHPWLKDNLDAYVKLVPKTKLYHLEKRHGLMMARVRGTQWASAPVFVFLDSHIECAPDWMEPLLYPIKENYRAVVVPRIHTIGADNFVFDRNNLGILGFSWTLGQHFLPNRHVHAYEPTPTVIMAGGLFAVSAQWWKELGGYDEEMRLYGGEEMEISFKIWQCGGTLEVVPCSRVGHVFRQDTYWKGQVYKVPGDEIFRNKLRAAEVWMDEYKEIVRFSVMKLSDEFIGNVDKQKAVRERLQCKPFSWLLTTIYPDMWVPDMQGALGGAFRNSQHNACIDCLQRKVGEIGVYPCHHQHGSQALLLTGNGELRTVMSNLEGCVGFEPSNKVFVATTYCQALPKGYRWELESETHHLRAVGTDKCLSVENRPSEKSPFSLVVDVCADGEPKQNWEHQK